MAFTSDIVPLKGMANRAAGNAFSEAEKGLLREYLALGELLNIIVDPNVVTSANTSVFSFKPDRYSDVLSPKIIKTIEEDEDGHSIAFIFNDGKGQCVLKSDDLESLLKAADPSIKDYFINLSQERENPVGASLEEEIAPRRRVERAARL